MPLFCDIAQRVISFVTYGPELDPLEPPPRPSWWKVWASAAVVGGAAVLYTCPAARAALSSLVGGAVSCLSDPVCSLAEQFPVGPWLRECVISGATKAILDIHAFMSQHFSPMWVETMCRVSGTLARDAALSFIDLVQQKHMEALTEVWAPL